MDISVRPVRRDEGELLDTVFAGLSPRSRHLRFHSPVTRLTTPVRRALLAVDGQDHVAVVAVSARGEPVAPRCGGSAGALARSHRGTCAELGRAGHRDLRLGLALEPGRALEIAPDTVLPVADLCLE